MKDEQALTTAQFAEVEAFAAVQLQPEELADEQFVRSVMGSLSGLLRVRRLGDDEATLQVGLYLKGIVGKLTRGQLDFAASRALSECEWLPIPAELIKLADGYERADFGPKKAARKLVAQRRGRLRMAEFRRLEAHEIPVSDFASVDPVVMDQAVKQRVVFENLDGQLVYRTPDAVDADYRARSEFSRSLRTPDPEQ